HFKARAEQAAARVAQMQALAEKAEAMAASTDWVKTADAIKALQAEWKSVGPVARREQKKLWDRFHDACDRFFTARKENLGRRREEWAQNLEKKEALIARATALAGSEDWDKGSAELKQLQAEWKSVGPVKKAKA